MKKLLLIMLLIVTAGLLQAIELTYDRYRNNLRGIRSYEEDDIEAAVEHFERNVINHPGKGHFHFNLGNSYYRKGEFDKALSEYDRALRDENFQDESLVWHNIGNSFFEQEQYEEALEMYRNAIITDMDNTDARHNYELTRRLLQEMQQEEQPQNSESDDDSEQEDEQQQQQQAEAEENDEEDGEDAQTPPDAEDDQNDNQDMEDDSDRQQELEDAEDILRTLLAREQELLEEEKERRRGDLEFRGRYW